MRNLILAFMLVVGGISFAHAQESLFPELDGLDEENVTSEIASEKKEVAATVESPKQEQNSSVASEEAKTVVKSEKDVQVPSSEKKVLEKNSSKDEAVLEEETEEEEEETEEEKERKIFLALNDVKTTLAPVRTVSFCSGVFVILSKIKNKVKEVSGTIKIGTQDKPFKFTNVPKDEPTGIKLQIYGTSCESMLNIPDIQIKKCVVEGMSEKRCRDKLLFIPINAE